MSIVLERVLLSGLYIMILQTYKLINRNTWYCLQLLMSPLTFCDVLLSACSISPVYNYSATWSILVIIILSWLWSAILGFI